MPTLVNYGGEDGGLYSMSSHVDLYCPARKRARISPGPFSFDGSFFEWAQSPSVDVLPDECLFEILRRVSDGRDRISSACVSKKWLVLMSGIKRTEMPSEREAEEGCLTRALEGKKATDVRLAAISVGTGGRGGLGKLSVRGNGSAQVTDLGLSAISRGCPSLKSLSLWNVPSVGDEGVIEIARGCPLLEKLDLTHCPSISNKGLIAIAESCPNLTALSLESCARIGNEGLQAVGRFCSNLQSLSIRDCPLVGDHGVSSLVSSATSLSKVKLQSLNITDFSIAVIGHYGKAVTSLTLSGLPNASEKGFWVMGNARGLQKLVSLSISSCRGVTDLSLEAIGKGSSVSLKQVCLRKCSFVSDEGLVGFSGGAAGSLESLQIEECHRITQTGIVGALSSCPAKLKSLTLVKCLGVKDVAAGNSFPEIPCLSLRSLSVRSCPGFGNGSLAAVGKLCPNLQNVDLSGLYGITDSGILSLLSLTKCLVSMNLTGCLNLTDEAVVSLVKLHGSTLESLNLDGCRKITDASLRAIAGDCFSLGDLDLSKCSVTDAGITALSSSGRINLQVLSLSGCSEVSNKSVAALEKLGKTLIGLNLQHCNAIHISTVEMLVESLWRCDILF